MIQKAEWMTNTIEASKNTMHATLIPQNAFLVCLWQLFLFYE